MPTNKGKFFFLSERLSLTRTVFWGMVSLLVVTVVLSATFTAVVLSRWWEAEYDNQQRATMVLVGDAIVSDVKRYELLALFLRDTFQSERIRKSFWQAFELTNFSFLEALVVREKGKTTVILEKSLLWREVDLEFVKEKGLKRMWVFYHPVNKVPYIFWVDTVSGVDVVCVFSLEMMLSHFGSLLARYDSSIGLVDEYGSYIVHTDMEKVYTSQGLAHIEGFREFVRSDALMTNVVEEERGKKYTYVIMRLAELPWFVVAERRAEVVSDVIRGNLVLLIAVFVGVFFFSVAIAYGLMRLLQVFLSRFVHLSEDILLQKPYEREGSFVFEELEVFVKTLEKLSLSLHQERRNLVYSRQMMQDVVNALGEGLLLVRTKGTVAYINPEGARMLEVVPKTDLDTMLGGSSQGGVVLPLPLVMAVKPYERGHEAQDEVMLYLSDGSKRWFFVQSKDWFSPERVFLGKMVVISDVTERKEFQEELLLSNRRLETALDVAHALFWEWNLPSGGIVLSQEWESWTGKVLPRTFDEWMEQLDEAWSKELREMLFAYCSGKRQDFVLEHALPSKDGGLLWVINKAHIVQRDIFQQPLRVIGVMVDITTIKVQQQQIEESLKEKETLLKEIHHRVKNNLQIISSLLSLQGEVWEDERIHQLVQDAQVRIRSMALVHEKLYQTRSFAIVDFRTYIADLIEAIRGIYEVRFGVEIVINAEERQLPLEICIPLGLWLSEALTNAFKYAFQDHNHPRLEVFFGLRGERLVLSVKDNGPGLPSGQEKGSSLGMKLLHILAGQLGGKTEFVNDGGLLVSVEFPLP